MEPTVDLNSNSSRSPSLGRHLSQTNPLAGPGWGPSSVCPEQSGIHLAQLLPLAWSLRPLGLSQANITRFSGSHTVRLSSPS